MKKWLVSFLALFGVACGTPRFVDTTIDGMTNLAWFGPDIWTVAHPVDAATWQQLRTVVERPGRKVLFVQLHDDVEGDDAAPTAALGWELLKKPLPPEDDKPWTVLAMPSKDDVNAVLDAIEQAHAGGKVVVFGCVHARDRTGLIRALLGIRLYKWSKDYAWSQMLMHGFRWELPALDAYFDENVRGLPTNGAAP